MVFGDVQVRMLGSFEVKVDGISLTRWRAGKARTLLEHLLVRRGTVVSRELLNDVLWPGEHKAPNNTALKVAAHALRRVLSDEGTCGARPIATVEYVDYGYVLHAPSAWIDCEEFSERVQRAHAFERRGAVELAIREYRTAVSLYRGPFLPVETSLWAEEQRAWFASTCSLALTRVADLALRQGDDFAAMEYSRKAHELDPYNEVTYRRMMDIHSRRGELGLALQWYGLCETRLKEDLGVDVSDETSATLVEVMNRSHINAIRV